MEIVEVSDLVAFHGGFNGFWWDFMVIWRALMVILVGFH